MQKATPKLANKNFPHKGRLITLKKGWRQINVPSDMIKTFRKPDAVINDAETKAVCFWGRKARYNKGGSESWTKTRQKFRGGRDPALVRHYSSFPSSPKFSLELSPVLAHWLKEWRLTELNKSLPHNKKSLRKLIKQQLIRGTTQFELVERKRRMTCSIHVNGVKIRHYLK